MRGEYYVYMWYVIDTGHVFYIGKGHGDRYKSIKKRNQTFMKYVHSEDCSYKILDDNLTEEDAFNLELQYIKEYKSKCMADANYHRGGHSGGDVFEFMPDDEKSNFITKMTAINRERCGTNEFRNQARKRMIEMNSDKEMREQMTTKIKKTWSDEKLRCEQRERSLNYAKKHPEKIKERIQKISKRCMMEFGGESIEFNSKKELFRYLKIKYNFCLTRQQEQFLFNNKNSSYQSVSGKRADMNGLRVYYIWV